MKTAVAESIPASLDEHPRVREASREFQVITNQAAATRKRRDRLVTERASLTSGAVAVLVTMGQTTQSAVDAKAAALGAEIAHVEGDLAHQEAAASKAEAHLRGVREQAREDIRMALMTAARQSVAEIDKALQVIDAPAANLAQLAASHGVDLPIPHLLLRAVADWRENARRVGLLIN